MLIHRVDDDEFKLGTEREQHVGVGPFEPVASDYPFPGGVVGADSSVEVSEQNDLVRG
jgi:hypothetical protein